MLELFDSSAKLVGPSGSILLPDDDEITRKLAMLFRAWRTIFSVWCSEAFLSVVRVQVEFGRRGYNVIQHLQFICYRNPCPREAVSHEVVGKLDEPPSDRNLD